MFSFAKKKPSHYEKLHEKWSRKHTDLQANLWNSHKDVVEKFLSRPKKTLVSSMAGLMILASPGQLAVPTAPVSVQETPLREVNQNMFFLSDLSHVVPQDARPLLPNEEEKITTILSQNLHLQITAELEGKRLNSNYGLIGAEQHLSRYPGDSMETHFENQSDATLYYSSGMAPGLGAWGYFAPSQQQFTSKDSLREKYYIAAQTFLSQGYMEHVKDYNDFFRYRKVVVVNPQNGKVIVADIADAGPSPWTGKVYGGSPEVMQYLERVDGAQKGTVLVFFLNDPEDKVPLGPIKVY